MHWNTQKRESFPPTQGLFLDFSDDVSMTLLEQPRAEERNWMTSYKHMYLPSIQLGSLNSAILPGCKISRSAYYKETEIYNYLH